MKRADIERVLADPRIGHLAPLYEMLLCGVSLITVMPGERVPPSPQGSGRANRAVYTGVALSAILGGRAVLVECQLSRHGEWWLWVNRWAKHAAFLDVSPAAEGHA